MNSIPKQQDGDGSNAAAANGSRSALEHTVLGVAPAAPAPPEPAKPPPADVDAASEASNPGAPEEPPAVTATEVIVAAPTIAVSGTTPAAPVAEAHHDAIAPAAAAAPESVTPRAPSAEPSQPASAELTAATPRYGTPSPGNGADGQQSTVLNADYLRVAREVAIAQTAPARAAIPMTAGAPPVGSDAGAREPAQDAQAADAASYRPSWSPPAAGSTTIRGFEPVPPVRAPLAESLSGGLLSVPDLAGRSLPRSTRPLPRPGGAPRVDRKGRWMLLCAVAFATVGVVSFGGRLLNRYRDTTERTRALTALENASPVAPGGDASGNPARAGEPRFGEGAASRALLANRPASDRESTARTVVVSASGSAASAAGGASGAAAGNGAPAAAEVATAESQLAATAARHLLAGNYAEALPVYRQLARDWPESSSYAAMARLLEKRVGTVNDTRTVAPAAP